MGKPNFSFQKRQKELAKKKKSEEKRQRKLEKNIVPPVENQRDPAEPVPTTTSDGQREANNDSDAQRR